MFAQLLHSYQEASLLAMQKSLACHPQLDHAAQTLVHAFSQQKKVLLCGNGGSAADAQHFAAELVGRFELERPGLPAIALHTDTSVITAIANDYHYDDIFAKQVQALGQADDVLVAISTSGNSKNIIKAIHMALQQGMRIIAFTGGSGGEMAKIQTQTSLNHQTHIHLCAPAQRTAHIQEVHGVWIHMLCACVDVWYEKNQLNAHQGAR